MPAKQALAAAADDVKKAKSGSDRKPEVLKISQDLASVIYGMSVMTWCFPLFETKLDLAAILVQTVMQKSTRVLSFQSFCTN